MIHSWVTGGPRISHLHTSRPTIVCTAFVLSRQSKQFVRIVPVCCLQPGKQTNYEQHRQTDAFLQALTTHIHITLSHFTIQCFPVTQQWSNKRKTLVTTALKLLPSTVLSTGAHLKGMSDSGQSRPILSVNKIAWQIYVVRHEKIIQFCQPTKSSDFINQNRPCSIFDDFVGWLFVYQSEHFVYVHMVIVYNRRWIFISPPESDSLRSGLIF